MSGVAVLSIDIGSSSVRAGLYDQRAEPVPGTASHRAHRFTNIEGGGSEADAESLFDLVVSCIDETAAAAPEGTRVVAAATCTFLHGLLGVDGQGRAVTSILTWADSRSQPQADGLAERLEPEEIRQRTGCPLHPVYYPAKIEWLRAARADLFPRVAWWCSIGEYCLRLFTGAVSCSLSIASATGMLDRGACRWDRPLLDAAGLDETLLSPLHDGEPPGGALLPRFARRWPALVGARWFAPLGDGACSNVGCGCDVPGRTALMIGTTGALRTVRDAGETASSHVPPGLWAYRLDRSRELVGGVLGDGGNLYEWMGRTLAVGTDNAAVDAALLDAVPAGHGLTVLPFLAGERSPGWSPDLRGAVIGLRLETSSLDILQAGMEAVAYRFAAIMRLLRAEIPGPSVVIGTGGALRASKAWGQILADVLQMPLSCTEVAEASSRGAALLALRALGYGAISGFPRPAVARVFLPRPGSAAAHEAAMAAQERLRGSLLGDFAGA